MVLRKFLQQLESTLHHFSIIEANHTAKIIGITVSIVHRNSGIPKNVACTCECRKVPLICQIKLLLCK